MGLKVIKVVSGEKVGDFHLNGKMEINFLGKLDICITASTKQLLILLCVVSCAWMHVSLNLGEPAFFFSQTLMRGFLCFQKYQTYVISVQLFQA